jgi:DNA ligase (NAD+)
VALYCPNQLGCPPQRLASLCHFAGRGQLNIDGLGEKVAFQLLETGLVKTVADIFKLTVEQIEALPRFAEVSAKNLIDAIETARRNATFSRLLGALGIRNVGWVVARLVASRYRRIGELLALVDDTGADPVQKLQEIPGIGEVIAESLVEFVRRPENRAVLEALVENGVDPVEPAQAASSGPLAGKTFVVTGTLGRSREVVSRAIEEAGGKVTGSVSKNTSFLLAGDNTGAAKLAAAQKHGVRVIREAELEAMLRGEELAPAPAPAAD